MGLGRDKAKSWHTSDEAALGVPQEGGVLETRAPELCSLPQLLASVSGSHCHIALLLFPGLQDFYASVLDVLTPDDVRVLVEMEDEFSRRGQFERIFPSRISSRYLRFFEQPRYFNILTTQWEQKYHGNKLKGDMPFWPTGGHI